MTSRPRLSGAIRLCDTLALPDTGSNYTILDSSFAKSKGFVIDSSTACSVHSVNNSPVSVLGTCPIKIVLGDHSTDSLALVCVDIFCPCILGWQALRSLRVLPRDFPTPQPVASALSAVQSTRSPFTLSPEDEAALLLCASDIKRSFPKVLCDVISDEPMRTDSPMVFSLRPDSDVPPLNVATARAVPRAYEDEARVVTNMLLVKNVIIEVSTPTAWCSPGYFVPKPGGKARIRLVVDYKQLNSVFYGRSTPSRALTTSFNLSQAPPSSSVSWMLSTDIVRLSLMSTLPSSPPSSFLLAATADSVLLRVAALAQMFGAGSPTRSSVVSPLPANSSTTSSSGLTLLPLLRPTFLPFFLPVVV